MIERSEPDFEIAGIAVKSDRRRRGIGKTILLSAVETEGIDTGKAETDDNAVGFYLACGFTAERTVKEYQDGIAVRYRRTLHR